MKKIKNIIFFASAVSIFFTSCTEYERPSFTVDKSISIEQQEEINSYNPLKTYIDGAFPNFKLGADISVLDYVNKALDYRVVNSNFNQISFSNGAQHADIVKADGSYDFSTLISAYNIANESGITIFGKNLVSNNKQNATYLNGLLQPIKIENPVISNSLKTSTLNDGSFINWTRNGGSTSVVDVDGLRTIKMISTSNSNNPTDLQLISSDINVVPGHIYEVIMYVRSESAGKGRITFEGMTNNTPSIDYESKGTTTETFDTDVRWKKLIFKISGFTGTTIKFHLDMGYMPNVTYYFNVASMYVYDTQAVVGSTNVWLEAECGKLGSGTVWQVASDMPTLTSNGKYLTVPDNTATQNNTPVAGNAKNNVTYTFNVSSSGNYTLFARGAAPNASGDSMHAKVDGGGWTTSNGPLNHTSFYWESIASYNLTAGSHTLEIAMREDGVKLDKFYLGLNGTDPDGINNTATNFGGDADNCNPSGFNLPRSEAEKTFIVNEQLTNWMTRVFATSKDFVKVWNVIDEPMDNSNPTQVKTGIGITPASDQFFWQDYLGGKDYGVKAFQLARSNGNTDDLLFVSDTGLESNLDKCDGLLAYVNYIDSKGQYVDGIGVKMHISVNSDKDLIASMFEKLATSGKMIAVTELYVDGLISIPGVPTLEELQLQSEMYKYVINTYGEKIPANQRYGITILGIKNTSNSSGKELLNSIWDKSLNYRLPSYVGFAEGIKMIK